MATLLLLRHAQAQSFARSDHERPLSAEGRRDAAAVGRVLAATGAPDAALVSTALRAHETAQLAAAHGAWHSDVAALDALYGADVDDALAALASHGRGDAVLVVGHEPSCSALLSRLTGARVRMRPATLARVEIGPGWDAIDPQWCSLSWVCPPELSGLLAGGAPSGR